MAVTKVTAATSDVNMDSENTNYTTARNGSAGASIAGSSSATTANGSIGQNKAGSMYHCYESFFSFAFTAVPATAVLVSELLDIRSNTFVGSPERDHEYREFDFGTSPDVPGDWRAPATYSAFPILGKVKEVSGGFTPFYPYVAGSKVLHDRIIAATTPLRMMVNTSRHRAGTVPTGAEYAGAVFANYADAGYRPKLILKTLANSRLERFGGSSVQLSDGTHVFTTWDGSNLHLVHSVDGTTTSNIDQLNTGTSTFEVDVTVHGWQTMSMCVDDLDNIWMVWKAGNAANSIVVQPFEKTAGSYAWTVKTARQLAMPAYNHSENADVPINNLAVTWNKTSNKGHLMVIGSHRMGSGDAGSIFYASVSCNNVLAGAGSYVAQSGTDPSWMNLQADDYAGTRPVNDTANCLDVWGDGLNGWVITADATMGVNNDTATSYVVIARYTMSAVGLVTSGAQYGRRLVATSKEVEPETKAKIVPLDTGRLAFCYGGEIRVYSTTGAYLGGADYKALGSFNPATTAATDYLYDKSSGKIWFYYIDAAVATRTLKRNGFSLTSYSFDATGSETSVSTTVGAASSTNPALRLPRGRTNERRIHIDVANITSGGVHSVVSMTDTFNVVPSPPVLGNRVNFNASNPATFTWTFSDVNTGDRQSAYQLQIIDASDASVDHDTGKVSSLISSYTLAAAVLANGKNYQWKVRVYDLNDAVSSYSALGAFSTLAGAITSITTPSTDNPADALGSTYVLTWSTTVITQAKYKVVLINTQTGATVLDTGFVVSAATSYTLTGLEDGVQYRVEVTTRSAIDVESSPGIRYITPNYIEPGRPVITAIPGDSYIELSLGNPVGPQPLGPDNGDFETDAAGWSATGGTIARSTTRAHAGVASGLLTSVGTPTQAFARNLISAASVVDELETYTLSMWWYSVAGYANSRISVDWYDAGGAYLSTGTTLQVVGAAAWEFVSDDFVAPAGAAKAIYGPTLTGSPPAATALWFDEVLFTTADLPLATSNDLYKSETGADTFIRIASVPPNGLYRDYAVKSGKSYDYYAEAVV